MNKEDYLKLTNKIIESSLKFSEEDFDYNEITDGLIKISGAMVAAFNLYNEDKTKTKTVAISSSSNIISSASKIVGAKIKGKEWDIIPKRVDFIKKKNIVQFSSLYDVSFGAITKKTAKTLERVFSIGNIYLIRVSRRNVFGDFIIFMKQGEELKNKKIVKEYVRYVELIVDRYQVEKKTKENEKQLKEAHKIAKMGRWDYFHRENKLKWSDEIYVIFETDVKNTKVDYELFLSKIHPEDREMVNKAWEKSLKDKKPYRVEHRIQAKNKKIKWVAEKCRTKFDKKGKPIHSVGIVQDISERKNMENILNENRLQQEAFISNLPGIAYRCLNDKNWTMLYINEYIKELTGYSAKEFLHNKKRSYGSIIYEDDKKYVQKEINKAIKKKESWNVEYRIKGKKEKIYWVEEKGKEVKEKGKNVLAGIILDVTEKKKIRKEIEEERERYKELSEQAQTFIWEVDKKAKYLYVSDNVEDILGYKAEEIIGKKTVFDLHPKEGFDEFKKGVFKVLKDKEKMQGLENPIVKKNGEICWVASAGLPVLDKKGNLLKYRGTDTNITERKKAEEELKTKKEQFELAVAGSNDGVWDWDLRTNELYLSPKWKEQLGYKNDELRNEFKTFENLLHPDDKEMVLEAAGKYIKGEIKEYSIEFRMLHKKSGYRWILAKGAAVYDEKGVPYRMAGSHSDITERKKYELELYESEEKFRQITENMGEVFWLRSADNMKMLYINPAYEKVWGRSCKSLYKNPQSFVDSVFDKDKPIVFKEFEKYEKGGRFDLEYRIVRPNKEIRWVRAKTFPVKNKKGEIIRHTGVATDITERKITEIKLLEKNSELEKFQLAVESASDHIVITDENGICLFMNSAAEKITGFKKEEIIGRKVGTKDNWGGLLEKKDYKDLWHQIKEKKKPFMGEITNKRKSGEKYEAKASIAPITNKKNEVTFFVGIERDITKEKKVDQAKTEFVSLASHQLRTPLSTISWYTEMLLDEDAGKINKEQKKYLKEIYNGNQRMVELINALLSVSRLELGTFVVDPEEIDPIILSESIINEIRHEAERKKQLIETNYEEKNMKINADPKLMRVIFQNLLSNAVKYTPENGTIKLEMLTVKRGDVISSKKINKNSLLITVSDTGYGIPYSQQEYIFSKLFRADNILERDTEGTGLGLYIVKEIINHSEGYVWFKSKENEGTTFYVTLPLEGMKKKKGTKEIN